MRAYRNTSHDSDRYQPLPCRRHTRNFSLLLMLLLHISAFAISFSRSLIELLRYSRGRAFATPPSLLRPFSFFFLILIFSFFSFSFFLSLLSFFFSSSLCSAWLHPPLHLFLALRREQLCVRCEQAAGVQQVEAVSAVCRAQWREKETEKIAMALQSASSPPPSEAESMAGGIGEHGMAVRKAEWQVLKRGMNEPM